MSSLPRRPRSPSGRSAGSLPAPRSRRANTYPRLVSRRTWTLLTSVVLIVVFGLLGAFVQVPYVALGPGPTYNTLGAEGNTPVVDIVGQQTFPTGGHLNMTTVSV